jgi:CubicO group peptidase (beta-lactamase class C family)
VVDDQDHDRPVRADAGRRRGDRPRCARVPYWPEFAAGGKDAGCWSGTSWATPPGCPVGRTHAPIEDLYDWEKATSLLAAQEPWWEPGTASGYHAVTQGYLVGEVVRRVTGQSLGTFFREQVSGPLGADFHIGLDPAEFGRVSNVIPPPPFDPTWRSARSPCAR